ncbi:MAG: hypothetical protein WCI72_00420 [archaeon]
MVTNEETTVKVSKWLIKEVEGYLTSSRKNQTEFPSKRNFVDKAIIELLAKRGLKL